MQIKVSARHGHVNESTQQFITEKAEKLLHIFQRIMMIEVVVDHKEDECFVEFMVSAEHKHDFVATGTHKELFAAVDIVLDKLEAQVRRYKEKIQDHRRRPSAGEIAGSPDVEGPGV